MAVRFLLHCDTGTPLIATKASALPLSSKLIQIVVLVLKVEASGIASIISLDSVVVAQSCDFFLGIPLFREEAEEE